MTDAEIYVDNIATSHFKDFNSLLEAPQEQAISKYRPVEEDAALRALKVSGSFFDVFCAAMRMQLQIWYEKLTEKERTALKNVFKKSQIYTDSPLSRPKLLFAHKTT